MHNICSNMVKVLESYSHISNVTNILPSVSNNVIAISWYRMWMISVSILRAKPMIKGSY